jgi:thymidylate synthase ThyX
VHLACEQASNVLTKVLEWGRLMAYLEQSTRYIAYNQRLTTGHYRYYRDPGLLDSPLGARYVGDMDRMFDTYGELLDEARAWLSARHPRQPGDSDFVHRQAVRAKGLDALRGLLPAGSLSNVGIYGTGQSYELLLVRMRAHPLPEARAYADLMLEELRKVIPSFLQRVDLADRGGAWGGYLSATRSDTGRIVERLFPDLVDPGTDHPSGPSGRATVELLDFDPDGEDKVVAAICAPRTSRPESEVLERVRLLGAEEKRAILHAYVGERSNRRHRPGRAFERTDYRFDVVTDYGAFRDLQRHRILTIEWQPLGGALGYDVPPVVEEAGLTERYVGSLERSRQLYEALVPVVPEQATYAVALAFRIRYTMQMNAREAMHVLELRSGPQGHPSYRWVAQEMHRQIAERAGHRLLAEAMSHVDYGAEDLERLESERRAEQRRNSVSAATNPATS